MTVFDNLVDKKLNEYSQELSQRIIQFANLSYASPSPSETHSIEIQWIKRKLAELEVRLELRDD